MRVDKLSSFEGETLIRFLLNHMGQEIRGRLMIEFPVIYRKLLGKDVDAAFNKAIKHLVLDRPLPSVALEASEQETEHCGTHLTLSGRSTGEELGCLAAIQAVRSSEEVG